MSPNRISRRSFLAVAAAAPLATRAAGATLVPVGLELYSVRDILEKDVLGTVRAVAQIGYPIVEFYAPYFDWTEDFTKQVRALLDDLGVRCRSTHNNASVFQPENLQKAIDRNHILGTQFVVMASAGSPKNLDGWKSIAETLTQAAGQFRPAGLRGGYHNHKLEFVPLEGRRPIEVVAANTPQDFLLQLDVGTCCEAGSDPVAWIRANPGRIRSIHCKDWAPGPGKGYKVLFGEGIAPWAAIFQAAENGGGVEYYLIEQEGSRFASLETVKRCLATWKTMRT
jgi:sugar phosphate isomerase/epimerase